MAQSPRHVLVTSRAALLDRGGTCRRAALGGHSLAHSSLNRRWTFGALEGGLWKHKCELVRKSAEGAR